MYACREPQSVIRTRSDAERFLAGGAEGALAARGVEAVQYYPA